MANTFEYSWREAGEKLGWSNKDKMVRCLKRDYREGEDWERIRMSKEGANGRPSYDYRMSEECMQQMIIRARTRKMMGNRENTQECAKIIITNVNRLIPIGVETISFIIKSFGHRVRMSAEHKIGRYRVDLYIHEQNVIVECDEEGHVGYDKEKEEARTKDIERIKGSVRWIRFNPDSKDFDFTRVIQSIVDVIF